jgi:tRNA1(Val) A37 N6-methylase TrmN6
LEYFHERDQQVEVAAGDFLDASKWPLSVDTFDAVIANPPYIRHHNLANSHKRLAHHYPPTPAVSHGSCR